MGTEITIKNIKVGVLGTGNMGSAIVSGLVGVLHAQNIIAHDKDAQRVMPLKKKFEIQEAQGYHEVMNFADYIILAVKPHDIEEAMASLSNYGGTIISIAAGVTIGSMEKLLGGEKKIIRAMPNTPILVGEGMTALAINKNITPQEEAMALGIFSSCGKAVKVREELMDAVTGVSGSGPAYGYTFIQSMADGAVKMGLPREDALLLSAQTLYGASKMVLEGGGESPMALRDRVCSPGGTTIEAVHELEISGFSGMVMNAIEAATLKSKTMGAEK